MSTMNNNTVRFRVHVGSIDFRREVGILIALEGPNVNKTAHVVDGGHLEWTDNAPDAFFISPTLRITEDMAEQLLAGLLELKVKSPTAGAIEGELKATKLHLEDMRRLVRIPKER